MSSAAIAYPAKSAEAFRTISEVATEMDVPQHVLRFWESRFTQIKPVKRAGGRRYYRPEDVDLLKGIRTLLYSDGLTIRGVQKVLKERGHRNVAELGRGGVPFIANRVVAPVVIEKIVYVEKPAEPVKRRPTHLRAVPRAMSLPFFFDEPAPAVPEPVTVKLLETAEIAVERAGVPVVPECTAPDEIAVDGGLAHHQVRLTELLAELLEMKGRLKAARAGKSLVNN